MLAHLTGAPHHAEEVELLNWLLAVLPVMAAWLAAKLRRK